MARGLIFDTLRTDSRDYIAANLFLPTHITRLICVNVELINLLKIAEQVRTLVIGDLDSFSFREPESTGCDILMDTSDLISCRF